MGADAVEVGEVVVEPVAVGLDEAFEGNVGAGDRVDRDFGVGRGCRERGEQGEAEGKAGKVHGMPWGVGRRRRADYGLTISLARQEATTRPRGRHGGVADDRGTA